MRKAVRGITLGVLASVMVTSNALAFHCVNASKEPGAGAQIVLNLATGELVWTTTGLASRFDQGLVDPATGEGFHGLLGFDFEGDGTVDATTWIGVGPDGTEIPSQAQINGPACRGVTNFETLFTECLGG